MDSRTKCPVPVHDGASGDATESPAPSPTADSAFRAGPKKNRAPDEEGDDDEVHIEAVTCCVFAHDSVF